MSLRVRRVVTGHDDEYKAIVISDESLPITTRRPGQEGCAVWATDRVPADNLDAADGSRPTATSTLPNGVVFRILRYEAGATGRMHRTNSLDYGVILSGCIVLLLDDGAEVDLNAGDTLVQRGTMHRWINRSDEPCTMAFVLINALPISSDHSADER